MLEGIQQSIAGYFTAGKRWVSAHRRGIKRAIAITLLLLTGLAILRFSWLYAGPLATILYTLMFFVGFAMIPTAVVVLRDIVPNFVGRLLFAIGQLGYGGSWLVQTGDGWEICPRRQVADEEQYWLDGDWHRIAEDSNMTRLGWAKWGITWHKTNDDFGRYRVDDQARDEYEEIRPSPDAPRVEDIASMSPEQAIKADSGQAVADGGGAELTAEKPDKLLPKPGVWVVNYREFWRDRMEEIGETGLLDDVERVAQREEALANTVSQNRLMIGSAFGLLLGAATGYVAMAGF